MANCLPFLYCSESKQESTNARQRVMAMANFLTMTVSVRAKSKNNNVTRRHDYCGYVQLPNRLGQLPNIDCPESEQDSSKSRQWPQDHACPAAWS